MIGWLLAGLIIVPSTVLAAANPALNPTAPPPGGQAASLITSSTETQKKIGSLIVGSSVGAPSYICLNAEAGSTNLASDPNCLSGWSDLVNGIGGPFVTLQQGNVASLTNVSSYTQETGYIHIRGSAPSPADFTIKADANNQYAGTSTSLYADGVLQDNYAGYLVGHVSINPVVGGSSNGKLCLNGTAASPNAQGYGCITSWDQVPGAVANFLQLQSVNPPVTQTGAVWLNSAFQQGALVLGAPPAASVGGTTKPFCGDGLCSQIINEQSSSSSAYCPLDCQTPTIAQSISTVSNVGSVTVNFSTSTDTSAGTGTCSQLVSSANCVYAVVIRSASSTPTFIPLDGQLYQTGGDGNFAIVYAGYVKQSFNYTFTDSGYGLATGRTYTYRLFQGNTYPRYRKTSGSYVQTTGVANASTGGSSCSGVDCDTGDNPVVLPVKKRG